MENHHFLGKSAISMAIFNSFFLHVYQRAVGGGGFRKCEDPQIDGLFHDKAYYNDLKWIIWGYPHFRKHKHILSWSSFETMVNSC